MVGFAVSFWGLSCVAVVAAVVVSVTFAGAVAGVAVPSSFVAVVVAAVVAAVVATVAVVTASAVSIVVGTKEVDVEGVKEEEEVVVGFANTRLVMKCKILSKIGKSCDSGNETKRKEMKGARERGEREQKLSECWCWGKHECQC